jgi:ABC-type dipeptide/oligopeptide/nickel transport system permease component
MRSVAFLSRINRAAMQEVVQSDFVRTARAKRLTGSILTETIFPGPVAGRCVLTAIDKRDLPTIQGSILFLSLVFEIVTW